jgi:peptidoglycan/LPS O-acetylase OafA/YrhL
MMAGCLLALYHDKIRAIVGERDLSIPAILGVIAIAFIGWPNPEHIVQAALVVSAVDVLVVVIVFEGARPSLLSRALSVSWLKHAGDLSYALYLTHYAIIVMYARVEARTPVLLNVRTLHPYFALALALTVTGLVTFVVAEVLTLFEAPFRRMRHELRHSRRNDPGLAPAYSPLSAPPSSISLSGSA